VAVTHDDAVDDVAAMAGVRVVMVVRLFAPWVGGMERQAHTLAQALVARGADVEILTGRWFRGTPRSERIEGIRVVRHQTLWDFGGVRGLRRFAGYLYLVTLFLALWRRRRTTDVIHVHGCNYHTAAAVLAGRLARIPVVVKLANSGTASDLDKLRRGAQLPLSGLLLPTALRADRFVALNPAVRHELETAGVDPVRIVDIPNGVAWGPSRDGHTLHDPARLVFVGRLHEQKGLDTLFAAVARLIERDAVGRVELRLVGDGPLADELRRTVRELGIADTVAFRGVRDDVLAEMCAADVFVLPSRAEGLSNSLLEALSTGTPCVVTDLPGNRAVVEHEHSGLVVPVDDAPALARALGEVLASGPLRQQLGTAGRARVHDRFTVDRVAERYLELYADLLREHAHRLRRRPPEATDRPAPTLGTARPQGEPT
jgi:L-malate glycosyltransferase